LASPLNSLKSLKRILIFSGFPDISSVVRGGAMGHLHPKAKLLCARYDGVFAFYLQKSNFDRA